MALCKDGLFEQETTREIQASSMGIGQTGARLRSEL